MDHLADLRRAVEAMPRGPGVYLWKDGDGQVLYVGKAADLRARTRQYVAEPSVKGGRLMAEARDLEFIAVRTEKEALVLEQTLIKRHKPRHNVRLTDDKQYPYLWLTPGPYPRLLKMHGRRARAGGTWFGPFPDGYGAFHVLQTLNDILPLRRCKTLPTEKCLYYDIGKCIAPCIQACTDDEYDALVERAKDVLRGRSKDVLADLQERLQAAAQAQRFEEAARLRDQLAGLKGVLERQHMVASHLEDRDIAAIETRGDEGVVAILHQRDGKVVGQSVFEVRGVRGPEDPLGDFLRSFYTDRPAPRHVTLDATSAAAAALETDLRRLTGQAVRVESPQRGDKVRWLEVAGTNARLRMEQEVLRKARRGEGAVAALRSHLGLRDPPRVIEGFDVSHLAGAHTRAAMVRFVDGEPDRQGYRTFNMRLVGEAAVAAGSAAPRGRGREVDDFASIGEAVVRRYTRLVEEDAALPDLVVIDGGPGQLGAAVAALAGAGVDVPVCSLAKREEEVFVAGRGRPLRLPRNDPGLQLLQRVRDEAHRFGIRQVRSKSTKGITDSAIDQVAGIGPKRRAELVRAFGGLEGLRQASVEDLTAVRGVTYDMARRIVEVLRD